MCSRLHTIQTSDGQTDRQTDGQTSCYDIVRAMHTRRAVIIWYRCKNMEGNAADYA